MVALTATLHISELLMKRAQFDLFAEQGDPESLAVGIAYANKMSPAKRNRPSEDNMAKLLQSTGRYRILRKLMPRPVIQGAECQLPRLAVILDTETTGLSASTDEVIEIGAVAFNYDDEGNIGNVVGTFNALQQPSKPIPKEITDLTGITDAMVAGQSIEHAQLDAFIAPADLIIAHNAGFDRPFCEKLSPIFMDKPWACSVREVDWATRGFEGSKLGYLIGQAGYFHDGHRATDDCHALLEVLSPSSSGAGADTAFAELVNNSQQIRVHLYAVGSPFDLKDQLRARGYRWSDGSDGRPKSWWLELAETDLNAELAYLQQEIYQRIHMDPVIVRLGAADRYKKP